MQFVFHDGGRTDAGFRGSTRDCACRAIAIATGKPYREVYDAINALALHEKPSKRRRGTSSARTGVHKQIVHQYLASLGWKWQPTMRIGQGCKVHMRDDELPSGRLVLFLSRHYVCVIDGVLYDTYDSSREGTRCVYGFYSVPDEAVRKDESGTVASQT